MKGEDPPSDTWGQTHIWGCSILNPDNAILREQFLQICLFACLHGFCDLNIFEERSQKPGNHPNFWEKNSRNEKTILGATFQGILGATGKCTHDLSHRKTQFSEQFLERLLELVGSQDCNPNSQNGFFGPRTPAEGHFKKLPVKERFGRICYGHRNHYQINSLGIFPANVPVKNYRINCWGIFIR